MLEYALLSHCIRASGAAEEALWAVRLLYRNLSRIAESVTSQYLSACPHDVQKGKKTTFVAMGGQYFTREHRVYTSVLGIANAVKSQIIAASSFCPWDWFKKREDLAYK